MNLEPLIQSTISKIVAGSLVSTSFIFKDTCLQLILPRTEPPFPSNSKRKRCKLYIQSFCCTSKETKRTILTCPSTSETRAVSKQRMCFTVLLQQGEALAAEEVSFPSLHCVANCLASPELLAWHNVFLTVRGTEHGGLLSVSIFHYEVNKMLSPILRTSTCTCRK